MPVSIVDAFEAMGRLTDDPAFGQQIQKSVASALAGDASHRDRLLIDAFLDGERNLLRRSSGDRYAEDLRRDLEPHFRPYFNEHPDLELIFLSRERQIVKIASDFLRVVGAESRGLIGPAALERIVVKALADTQWSTLKVSIKDGVEYNSTRLRTLQDCIQLISTLFEHWLILASEVMGARPTERAFERAYASVAARYSWLPTVKILLGAMPIEVLATDKARHLQELETETTSQARGLRVADEGLRRQADRLQQTVTELQETRRQLEAVSQAKSAFIDVVSHQFRTPLSTVRWNAEMLHDELAGKEGFDPVHKDAIANIRTKSVYLIETLDRVFTTLEIDTGTIVLDKRSAFLWEVVQDVYNHYEKDIKAKGMAWTFKRSKEQLKEITFDKAKIQSVLKILIGNAVAYGRDSGKITVDVRNGQVNGKDFLVCAVTDDGLGLPKGDDKKFFDKFFRSKPSVLKVADGTGLGNYIVKHLIEAHHGFVAVSSEGEGKGTTVEFGLPLA